MVRTQDVRARLALDAAAVEVVRALRGDGVESILLKGRSVADRLYPAGDRGYRDVDLLVAANHQERAGRVLAGLGFADVMAGARDHEHCRHARTWVHRGRSVVIDLHVTLAGARADPDAVYPALSRHTRTMSLGGQPLTVLDDVGLALHLALHAAHHGVHEEQPLTDLSRGLAAFDPETARAAAGLAARLDAMPAFVMGLRLVPAGGVLADELGRGVPIPAATAVQALADVRGVGSIALVLAEPGWRRPLAVIRRAFPSRTVLRHTMPLARWGGPGVVAAYAVRPLWMAVGLPAAVRAWRSAARAGRQ